VDLRYLDLAARYWVWNWNTRGGIVIVLVPIDRVNEIKLNKTNSNQFGL
jgi:hypothetical protein